MAEKLLTDFFESSMQVCISLGYNPYFVAVAFNKILNDGVKPCDLWYVLDMPGIVMSGSQASNYFAKFALSPSVLEKLQMSRASLPSF